MKEKRSTKTYVEYEKNFLKLIKANGDNLYFLKVLYYYVRRALSSQNFNLRETDGFIINGRFFGDKQEVIFTSIFNTILKSLGLALSIRAIMLDKTNLQYCHDNRLLFYDLDNPFISWNAHRAIMECMYDEDFKQLYEIVLAYKEYNQISDDQKDAFSSHTIRPEYKNFDVYLKKLACDPDYKGKSVIKDNEYLYSEVEDFVVPESVDYIGNTAFAYCNNLHTLTFTRKVMFGSFPIIECNKLRKIVVPDELIDYYKEKLPYYKDIIGHNEQSIKIDPETLWHVFDKKVTSYKYFWFWAILDISCKKKKNSISYMHLLAKMVAIAWRYVNLNGYSLGVRDQLSKYMNILKEKLYLQNDSKEKDVEEKILEFYKIMNIEQDLGPLLKNVPYRFLSPWIPFISIDDVEAKSNDPDATCLYALKEDYILINPQWFAYLNDNYDDVLNYIITELNSYLMDTNSISKQ